ncbi:NAD-dependent epimerase/dehydratase family protein [Streptomyces sp. NPDC051597]|uniref:NAD-dependent epimerase/dehydratase family protein n=1 Tax=Streptomyces sp. NPDC051597 TaxID=3155049 RepID=UPI003413F297
MKVLPLGSTVYIGSVVVRQLTAHGHQVVHSVKEDSRLPTGEPVRIGDLADPDSLRAVVTEDIDGVTSLASAIGDGRGHRGR